MPKAANQLPSRARLNVCRLNDEKVVKPPQMPTMTKMRRFWLAGMAPSGMVRAPKKPMTKLPRMLMAMVPQGKLSPQSRPAMSPSP